MRNGAPGGALPRNAEARNRQFVTDPYGAMSDEKARYKGLKDGSLQVHQGDVPGVARPVVIHGEAWVGFDLVDTIVEEMAIGREPSHPVFAFLPRTMRCGQNEIARNQRARTFPAGRSDHDEAD